MSKDKLKQLRQEIDQLISSHNTLYNYYAGKSEVVTDIISGVLDDIHKIDEKLEEIQDSETK